MHTLSSYTRTLETREQVFCFVVDIGSFVFASGMMTSWTMRNNNVFVNNTFYVNNNFYVNDNFLIISYRRQNFRDNPPSLNSIFVNYNFYVNNNLYVNNNFL